MTILPLSDGDVLTAAADPWLARISPDGALRWRQPSRKPDYRAQHDVLSISHDGTRVGFGVKVWGEEAAVFDVSNLSLTPGSDESLAKPRHDGLEIDGWKNTYTPTLAGTPLPLEQFEMSRSLAIHPDQRRFVLGAEWYLRAFDRRGMNSGGWLFRVSSGRSTSRATGAMSSRPMATARSAGT